LTGIRLRLTEIHPRKSGIHSRWMLNSARIHLQTAIADLFAQKCIVQRGIKGFRQLPLTKEAEFFVRRVHVEKRALNARFRYAGWFDANRNI
jgi:hypothetical protein